MKYYRQKNRFWRHLPTYPLIFPAIVPIFILDLWIEMYHRWCFPFYKIPYVKRREYIKIDRQKLNYLNPMEKLNCMYCGYANGVVKYWSKIMAETELYWCGIQHEKNPDFKTPEHHAEFVPYGDKEVFTQTYK